jgi:hypothetical protein
MATLIAIPVLGLLVIIQSAVVSRIPLLYGTADVVLLALLAWSVQERVTTAWHWSIIGAFLVSMVTAAPVAAVVGGYLLATLIARLLRRRIWQIRLLAMLAATFLGTLLVQSMTALLLRFNGVNIPLLEAFNIIVLPSALLNLIAAVPVYAIIGDLANWLYPEEIDL